VVYKATGSEKSDRPVFSGKVNQLRQAAFPEPQNPIHFVGGERESSADLREFQCRARPAWSSL